MLVFLDTNAYLRLAKRVRPAVGVVFGHKGYVLTIHKSVEDEVHRSAGQGVHDKCLARV